MGETITGIYERNDIALRTREGLPEYKGWYLFDGIPRPESAVTEICENGIKYLVDVENGQKTGFSWIRNITVPLWPELPRANVCWTVLPIPVPSALMQPWGSRACDLC